MRLQKYLTEDIQAIRQEKSEWWSKIEKDCEPFLKEAQKAKKFLWRGAKIEQSFEKKTVRKGREPRFIPKELHNYIDEKLKKMFGWRPRTEGLFTGSLMVSRNYGEPRIIFPIGKFKFIAMDKLELMQLYQLYDNYEYLVRMEGIYNVLDAVDKKLQKYETRNLSKFLKMKEYECIVNCKTYYSVDKFWADPLMHKLDPKVETLTKMRQRYEEERS